jgi:hypothetical protein
MAAAKKIPTAVLFGVLAALGMIAVTIITYFHGIYSFIGTGSYFMYLFPVVFAVVAPLVEKRRKGGLLGFRQALKVSFGTIVLALAIQVLFAWILVKWIDPRFGRALPAAVLKQTEATWRRFGVPEDEIDSGLALEKGSDPFSFGRMLTGLARNYIVGFIVAVLCAAVIGQRIINRGQKV